MSDVRNDEEESASETRDDVEAMHKRVVRFQTIFTAWFSSRMEKDKQILILSGGAVGLLMTFWSDLDDIRAFGIWLAASVVFVITIGTILWIFGKNGDYIGVVLEIEDGGEDSGERGKLGKHLKWADTGSSICFVVGILLTIILAIYQSDVCSKIEDFMSSQRDTGVVKVLKVAQATNGTEGIEKSHQVLRSELKKPVNPVLIDGFFYSKSAKPARKMSIGGIPEAGRGKPKDDSETQNQKIGEEISPREWLSR